MGLARFLKCRALEWALPLPFDSRHQEYSTITFIEEDRSRPTRRLVEISLKAIERASQTDLSWLSKRMKSGPFLPEIWPGEHYKLLAGLVSAHQPKRIMEIGTFLGLSALAMKANLPAGSEIITIDLIPWNEIRGTVFTAADFADGRLRQTLGDLSDPGFFQIFAEILSGCDLLFVDGPKNVQFEEAFIRNLAGVTLPSNALVLFDDTRQWNMLEIWHKLSRPKLDLTSFGHWTGTGIVDWNG